MIETEDTATMTIYEPLQNASTISCKNKQKIGSFANNSTVSRLARSNKSSIKNVYQQNNSIIVPAQPAQETSLKHSETISDLSVSSSVASVSDSKEFSVKPLKRPENKADNNEDVLKNI